MLTNLALFRLVNTILSNFIYDSHDPQSHYEHQNKMFVIVCEVNA